MQPFHANSEQRPPGGVESNLLTKICSEATSIDLPLPRACALFMPLLFYPTLLSYSSACPAAHCHALLPD